jgi:glycerophosphoryl diester phosphodiesterase
VIAHKGASGLAPENTLSAIQLALDMGVDMIEIDVRNTSDDEIVVFHDERLERTTNGKGFLHDYTLEEVKLLDAGSWFDPRFTDERIPTLKEVLDLVNGKCKVLIEIKHMDHPHYNNFAEKLVNVINQEKDGAKWVILQSYESQYLDEVHALDDHIQTKKLLIGEDSAPLFAFYIETKMHLGRSEKEGQMRALNPHYATLSPRRVFRMHSRGYKVYTYPVNDRETMIKVLNMGVDGIITDYPNRLLELRAEVKKL